MRHTATMRCLAGPLAVLWLLGCVDRLAAQDVAMSNRQATLAPTGTSDVSQPRWDDRSSPVAANGSASNPWSIPSTASPAPGNGSSGAAALASADAARAVHQGNVSDGSTPRSVRETSLPLKLPIHEEGGRSATGRRADSTQSLVAVAGSLAAVLGVFFLLAWVMRRAKPQGQLVLPDEAFEVLGHAALANRQQVQLLRCGRKLLLVSVTPTGAETLTEITEPAEVDRLAMACRESRSHGATAAFHRVLAQWNARRLGHELLSGDALSDYELDRSLVAGRSDERAWGDHV